MVVNILLTPFGSGKYILSGPALSVCVSPSTIAKLSLHKSVCVCVCKHMCVSVYAYTCAHVRVCV